MKEKIKKSTLLLVPLLLIPVISVMAANYKTFIVEKVFGYDKLLVTDGFSQYIISYSFGCLSFDFFEGKTIWIDTYFSPGFYDTIIVEGLFDTKTCTVSDSEEVNLKQYFVVAVIDNKDEIIVKDKYGDKYLVEYGIGCGLSMWRYEGKYIDIDIGGSFLDGIGDRIYLFDSNDDCKVWGVQEISSESWGGSSFSLPQCPANSTFIGNQCVCNEGYTSYNNGCITYTEKCKISYGENVYGKKEGDKLFCYCKNGYEWNSSQTACIKTIICPLNSQKINNVCVCNEGYVMRDNKCITYTEDCIQHFGSNVYGVKGDTGNSSCYCKEGYEWNLSRTTCIKSIVCPKNSSKIAGECVCDDGYGWDSSGRVCIEKVEEKEGPEIVFEEASQEEADKEISVTEEEPKEEKIVVDEEQKSEGALKSITAFLASIFDIIKNAFSKLSSWF